jgi:adenylate cyclase class IV
MSDRIFDLEDTLRGRNEVLRIRTWRPKGAPATAQMAWKGATHRSTEGYKLREELELMVEGDGASAAGLLGALGYTVSQSIDRYVEVYRIHEADIRLEWYPRMDVLVEVEGAAAAIEAAIRATGMPRSAFEPEPLVEYVRRYEERSGATAALAVVALQGGTPSWERL